MKQLYIILLFLLPLTLPAQKGNTLNIMTYNLRFGELASLEDIAGFIKSQNADIVALQECDWKTNRERAPQQKGKAFVNELAYHTGMFGIYGKAIDYQGGYYGVGVLSKYPVVRSERILLPNPEPKKEQRTMLICDIELPDKSILTFICTHLEVSSANTRAAQISFINDKIKSIKNPVILAGDMNAKPFDKEIAEGFSCLMNMTNTELTYSSMKPEMKIDYIFGYPKEKMEMVSTKVHVESKLSDHFPVSSIVKIK